MRDINQQPKPVGKIIFICNKHACCFSYRLFVKETKLNSSHNFTNRIFLHKNSPSFVMNNNMNKENYISLNPSLKQANDLSLKNGDSSHPYNTNKKRRISFDHKESHLVVGDKRVRRLSKISSSNRSPSFSEFSFCHDEIDAQLAEELKCYSTPVDCKVETTPIPLLTPPASPIPIKSEESDVVIYEWPSNLVVDNALIAASKLHPLSLSEMEEIDECREPIKFPILEIPQL